MGESLLNVDDRSLEDLKKLVVELLEENAALKAEIATLREEIARLKGLKGRPKLKPSGMAKASEPAPERRAKRRRKGQRAKLVVHEERVVKAEVPAGARFKGYQDFVVQELVIRGQMIRFRRERWLTADGQTVVAPLPAWVQGHFGPDLKRYVLAQYYRGQVTIPRLTAHPRI
jgi:regulator of replication initiation timing